MDKIGTLWGGLFGALWGYLSVQFRFEFAELIVDTIDQGFENAMGITLSREVGDGPILMLLGAVVGCVVGGVIGTGVRKNA